MTNPPQSHRTSTISELLRKRASSKQGNDVHYHAFHENGDRGEDAELDMRAASVIDGLIKERDEMYGEIRRMRGDDD